jgi:predicted ATPase
LGIFVGGCTLEAVEAILSHDREHTIDVLEGLAALLDQSLVQREEDEVGGYRFRLLESVREFALEQGSSCWTRRADWRSRCTIRMDRSSNW